MANIVIISSSVRDGRNSHRVSLFFQNFIESKGHGVPDILDLKELDFPLFHERLGKMSDPKPEWVEFAKRLNEADGIVIVTPEYNGGYPASLKNIVDFMYKEWHRKPMAIATVSDGRYGGTQVIQSLQFSLWKIGAWTVPSRYHVSFVKEAYDEKGIPSDPGVTHQMAGKFIDELMWCINAKRKMDDSSE